MNEGCLAEDILIDTIAEIGPAVPWTAGHLLLLVGMSDGLSLGEVNIGSDGS